MRFFFNSFSLRFFVCLFRLVCRRKINVWSYIYAKEDQCLTLFLLVNKLLDWCVSALLLFLFDSLWFLVGKVNFSAFYSSLRKSMFNPLFPDEYSRTDSTDPVSSNSAVHFQDHCCCRCCCCLPVGGEWLAPRGPSMHKAVSLMPFSCRINGRESRR